MAALEILSVAKSCVRYLELPDSLKLEITLISKIIRLSRYVPL